MYMNIGKLSQVGKEYNNISHKTVKIEAVDVEHEACINFDIHGNFKIGRWSSQSIKRYFDLQKKWIGKTPYD